MRYLLVVSVPIFPLGGGKAAVESAFALHLQKLLASFESRVTAIDVIGPAMSAEAYAATKGSLREVDPVTDRITLEPAFPLGCSWLRYLIGLPALLWRLWRTVGRAGWVHAGPSQLFFPLENLGLLIGWLRGRKTIYVVDIDQRQSAHMNQTTGRWTRGVAWRRRNVHDRWFAIQHHLARWFCSTLFLKSAALVRDFGRGKPHVHCFLDCAHSIDMVLTPAAQAEKFARMAKGTGLRACYFGRLVAYKGIDRMLRTVQLARSRGVELTFDVFGSGDRHHELIELTARLGLGDAVHFHGPRTYGPEFFAELAGFDILLAAPLSEDTPRSAIDAQALGMGVVAFDTYYYKDLAAADAGVALVPWPDHEAMAAALAELAADRDRLVDLARRGLAFATKNTQEHWLRKRAEWTPGMLGAAAPRS